MIEELRASWENRTHSRDDVSKKLWDKEYIISISITRSPCGTCGEKLRAFADERRSEGYKLRYHIRASTLYHGKSKAAFEDAKKALEDLVASGHTIRPWNFLGLRRRWGGDEAVPEDIRKMMERRAKELEETLDNIKQTKVG